MAKKKSAKAAAAQPTKKTKKKKGEPAAPPINAVEPGVTLQGGNKYSQQFSALANAAYKRFKINNVLIVGQEVSRRMVAGMYLPALSLRYLFRSTVLPYSRVIQLVGRHGSCKSTLMWEMMRWHLMYGGFGKSISNESRDQPELRAGIWGHNKEWEDTFEFAETTSIQMWQGVMSAWFDTIVKMYEDPEIGHVFPFMIGLDSLTAKSGDKKTEQISTDGFATQGFPTEARLIGDYLKTVATWQVFRPITLVVINHLKDKIQTETAGRRMPGSPEQMTTTPGGSLVLFQETFEFELHKQSVIDYADFTAIQIKFKSRKNSLGAGLVQMTAGLVYFWDKDPETGKARQQIRWDWHRASIDLWAQLAAWEKTAPVHRRLQEVCNIQFINSNKVYSRDLGVSADSPVTCSELGAILEQHPDILEQIYPILDIHNRTAVPTGTDFRKWVLSGVSEDEQNRIREAAVAAATASMDAVVPTQPPGENQDGGTDEQEAGPHLSVPEIHGPPPGGSGAVD